MSFNKRVIMKSYLQLDKNPLNLMEEKRRKLVNFINIKNFLAP